jgi:hypothetical protein
MNAQSEKWWERQGKTAPYPELRQYNEPHCVFASIAGAINHLANRNVWTPGDLLKECVVSGLKAASFEVANVAVVSVSNELEAVHHNRESPRIDFGVDAIRKWIDCDGVVILSMELADGNGNRLGQWHMFALVANQPDCFQVWDTNGFRGFITHDELVSGIDYPNGMRFVPHDKEDTLFVRRK